MLKLVYQYFFEKRPENIKKCDDEKRRKFDELVDQLLQKDDNDDEFKGSVQYSVESDVKIDELSWNCTKYEGKKSNTSVT